MRMWSWLVFFIGKGRGIVGPAPLPDKIMMSSLYMFSLESDLKKKYNVANPIAMRIYILRICIEK